MASNSRIQLEEWLKTIDVPPGATVIDVGGAQKPVKGRTRSWAAKNYYILDLPVPHEEKIKPDIAQDIDGPIERWNTFGWGSADVVFCLEVAEYWLQPLEAMRNIASMLSPGGLLFASFHLVYPEHNPLGKDYLRYTRSGVMRLLEEAGFGEIEIKSRRSETADLAGFYSAEGMRMAHGDVEHQLDHDSVGWLVRAVKK